MQATLIFTPPTHSLPLVTPPTKALASPCKSIPRLHTSRCPKIKATAVANDTSTVDYSSISSVFPAEACETIGGEACDVEMYPEVKLKPEARSSLPRDSTEQVDREYMEYDGPKTVFPAEACDDLGGEFCQPEYQRGVY